MLGYGATTEVADQRVGFTSNAEDRYSRADVAGGASFSGWDAKMDMRVATRTTAPLLLNSRVFKTVSKSFNINMFTRGNSRQSQAFCKRFLPLYRAASICRRNDNLSYHVCNGFYRQSRPRCILSLRHNHPTEFGGLGDTLR